MGDVRHDARLEVTTDCDDDYIAIFFDGRDEIARVPFTRAIPRSSGLRRKEIEIPDYAVERGYTSIRIVPALGMEPFVFGHLRVFDVRPVNEATPEIDEIIVPELDEEDTDADSSGSSGGSASSSGSEGEVAPELEPMPSPHPTRPGARIRRALPGARTKAQSVTDPVMPEPEPGPNE